VTTTTTITTNISAAHGVPQIASTSLSTHPLEMSTRISLEISMKLRRKEYCSIHRSLFCCDARFGRNTG
jgi:hypothetical protein